MAPKYCSDIPLTPKPVGPYSTAVVSGNLLFTSGQVPICPETNKMVEGDVEAQTKQVMLNLKAIFDSFKVSFANVIKTNIFLANMDDFSKVNAIYSEYIGNTKPARSTVEVARLPLDALVEIEMIAELP